MVRASFARLLAAAADLAGARASVARGRRIGATIAVVDGRLVEIHGIERRRPVVGHAIVAGRVIGPGGSAVVRSVADSAIAHRAIAGQPIAGRPIAVRSFAAGRTVAHGRIAGGVGGCGALDTALRVRLAEKAVRALFI
jgi:hypothetical protein